MLGVGASYRAAARWKGGQGGCCSSVENQHAGYIIYYDYDNDYDYY